MKLKSIKIKNFRGYSQLVEIPFNNITAFIGKNDAGKSTILEALEIFFNNKLIICEENDLNKDAEKQGNKIIERSCIFHELPERLVLDSTSETNLQDEYLLNENGDLEIKKTFDVSYSKPKESIFIVCNHPTSKGCDDLLLIKNAELQKRAKKIQYENEALPFTSSAPLRKLIWKSASSLDIKLIDLEVTKEDSKNIYSKLQEYMPLYALFQSDRDNSDENKEVTDPMKIAVQNALKNVESEIELIKNEVKRIAIKSAEETLEKLKEMDPDIAESLSVEFKSAPKFDSAFKLSINSDNGISINKRGSGVRRLILLNFFRAEVDRRKSNKNTSV
ncbi:ATP-binding protein, partial [Glaesserella parasuis]|nr:ATP-binding protein [Glaesserella parasuis]